MRWLVLALFLVVNGEAFAEDSENHLVPGYPPRCWLSSELLARLAPKVDGWEEVGSLWGGLHDRRMRVARLLSEGTGARAVLEVRESSTHLLSEPTASVRIPITRPEIAELVSWLDEIGLTTRFPNPKSDEEALRYVPITDGHEYWYEGSRHFGKTDQHWGDSRIGAVTRVLFLDPALPPDEVRRQFLHHLGQARLKFAPNPPVQRDAASGRATDRQR